MRSYQSTPAGIRGHVVLPAILFGTCLLIGTHANAGLVAVTQERSVSASDIPNVSSQSSVEFEDFFGSVIARSAEASQVSYIRPDLVEGTFTASAGQFGASASSSMSLTFDLPVSEAYALYLLGSSSWTGAPNWSGGGGSFSLASGDTMLVLFTARQQLLDTAVTLPAGRYTITASAGAFSGRSPEFGSLYFTFRSIPTPEPSTFLLATLAGLGLLAMHWNTSIAPSPGGRRLGQDLLRVAVALGLLTALAGSASAAASDLRLWVEVDGTAYLLRLRSSGANSPRCGEPQRRAVPGELRRRDRGEPRRPNSPRRKPRCGTRSDRNQSPKFAEERVGRGVRRPIVEPLPSIPPSSAWPTAERSSRPVLRLSTLRHQSSHDRHESREIQTPAQSKGGME